MKYVSVNGASIPAIGLDTLRMTPSDIVYTLPLGLKRGLRHVDTAQIYGNEAAIGEMLQMSGVPRDEMFLATKVWPENYRSVEFRKSVEVSLANLRCSHVDLLFLHWPSRTVPLADQIGELNEVVSRGYAKYIGLANFPTDLMIAALNLSENRLIANQVEYHPYLNQDRVLSAARKLGIAVVASHTEADGSVCKDPLLLDIAAAHGKTITQVVLRWLVQQDQVVALTRAVTATQMAASMAVSDFELSAEDVADIRTLARPDGRLVNPAGFAPSWDTAPTQNAI